LCSHEAPALSHRKGSCSRRTSVLVQVKPSGKKLSEGMERLTVELGALEQQAKAGKVDLSKVQVEGVIVYVVKQKFQPAQASK